jgi:Phosphoribosyl-ATP pyrophosphohydrolase
VTGQVQSASSRRSAWPADAVGACPTRWVRVVIRRDGQGLTRRMAVDQVAADIGYVNYSTALTYGIDLDSVLREVHL